MTTPTDARPGEQHASHTPGLLYSITRTYGTHCQNCGAFVDTEMTVTSESRLIAAAPRMKELLELLLHYRDTDHPDEDLHAAFAEARALLRELGE